MLVVNTNDGNRGSEVNKMDEFLCEKCQEKFDEQQGQLLIRDMCEDCKAKSLMVILDPEDRMIH
jgi:Zn finger protein HypA/HybF involved in hydrogenase expression